MALGRPAVVSDREPMKTVAGDAARLVDPTDEQAMASAIADIWRDQSLRQRLAKQGRRRAAEFRWPKTARQTWQVYERLLGET